MDNEQFDLGEALGGYEQAQADRNFYLSMMQQGQQNRGAFMASPIAAYLAGVSGVKMATMRQKVQAIQDERQAKKDALAATEKAQNYGLKIQQNLLDIAKAANQGDISKSTAAAMYGYLVKEAGGTPISYDADNGILTYQLRGDEYEADLSKYGMSKKDIEAAKDARQQRSQDAIAARQERGSELRMKEAEYKATLNKSGGSSKNVSPSVQLSGFKDAHRGLLDILNNKDSLNDLDDISNEAIQGFFDDYNPEWKMGGAYKTLVDYVGKERQDEKERLQKGEKAAKGKKYNRWFIKIPNKSEPTNYSTTEQTKSLDELWGE